ncbi:MAG: hypothetical protein ACJ0J6_03165 [Dehalococcoidia bacterium]|tara:strand:- start:1410 stop:2267 length:858 start_codon:yes stop_codon:yes gene_type:complete
MNSNLIEIPAVNKIPKLDDSKSINWEDFKLGALPSQCTMTISEENIDRWCNLYNDDARLYLVHAPDYITYYSGQNVLTPFRDISAGLATLEVDFFDSIPRDIPLTVTGKVTNKSVKKGRGYVEWETNIFEKDNLLQTNRRSWFFTIPEEEINNHPEKEASIPIPPRPESWESKGLALLLSQDRMNDFEGPGEVNGHTNVALAKKQGNPGPLSQGAFGFGLLTRLLAKDFENQFTLGGKMSLKFVRPVWAGEQINAFYSIIDKKLLRVWVEKDNKEEVIVGTVLLA